MALRDFEEGQRLRAVSGRNGTPRGRQTGKLRNGGRWASPAGSSGQIDMLQIIARRVLVAIPTLFLVSLIVFGLQKLLPGDPLLTMAGEERDPAVIEFLREKYRLNDPFYMQYLYWVRDVLTGDFGNSLRTGVPVSTLIAQKLPVTIQLAVMAMIFALLIGIPTGIMSAVKKGKAPDYAANAIALSGVSIPNFWLGIILIMIVSVQWRLLPASGYVPLTEDPIQSLRT